MCGAPNKEAFHVLTHPDAGVTAKATTLHSTAVQDHLWGCDKHPDLLTLIPKLFLRMRAGMPIRLHLHPVAACPALRSQAVIGWNNFLIDWWSVKWFCLQRQHCCSAGSQKLALCWLTSTLKTPIQGQWHLWDFPNQHFCGQTGMAATDKQARLNTRIDQEFAVGWANLTIVNAQIHSQGQTLDSAKVLSLEEKCDWLGSMNAG